MKIVRKILLVLAVYLLTFLLGTVLGVIFGVLRITGRIKIKGHLPVRMRSLIISYKHSSFFDVFLITLLYFPWYLFNPFSFIPIGTPAKEKYYSKKWFLIFRPFCIPLNREGGINRKTLFRMAELLKKGRRIAIAPEGGRTDTGTEFVYSKKGKRMRKLQEGIGWLAINSRASILSVWVETIGQKLELSKISFSGILKLIGQLFTKTKIVIKIGEPFRIQPETLCCTMKEKRQEATKRIADALLNLGDEE